MALPTLYADSTTIRYQYHESVPSGRLANLAFRKWIINEMRSPLTAAAVMRMCAVDPLFWLKTFAFVFDPDDPPHVLPMIPWPFQQDMLREMYSAVVDGHDLRLEKSRKMAATWTFLAVGNHLCQFHDNQLVLVLSRKERVVDGDLSTLLPKIDFMLDHVPRVMRGNIFRRKLHIGYPDRNSAIIGDSTEGDAGRSGRYRFIALDEFAAVEEGHEILKATRSAAKCRMFISTPKGVGNAFYDLRQTGIRNYRLHWSEHPLYTRGLYTANEGRLQVLDTSFVFPDDYPFVLDGKLRSPWYDNECLRCATRYEIAQELDIDYGGSDYSFYEADLISPIVRRSVRPAVRQGDFVAYGPGSPLDWADDSVNGRFRWWCNLDVRQGLPRDRQYVIGCDVSTGAGSSNSTMCIGDVQERRVIGTYANPYIRPEDFARLACAVGEWLYCRTGEPAMLVWESNGPGGIFGDVVVERGYPRIHWRQPEGENVPLQRRHPGFWQKGGPSSKTFHGSIRRALFTEQTITCHDELLFNELPAYVYGTRNDVVHSAAMACADPSGARDNHGDRVIALGVMLVEMEKMIAAEASPEAEIVAAGNCFASRAARRHREETEHGNRAWWRVC